MFAAEACLVTEEFLARDDVYNLRLGGFGGFDYINNLGIPKFKGRAHSDKTKQVIAKKARTRTHSEETRSKISSNNWAKTNPEAHRAHMAKIRPVNTPDSNKKRSESLRGRKQKIKTCPHCGKSGGNGMSRYHFDNCNKAA
jgi:hypothetical protein